MRELSQYIRTACCQAPVFQELELQPMVCPVRCVACGREAGAPGVEDVPENQAQALDRPDIRRLVPLTITRRILGLFP